MTIISDTYQGRQLALIQCENALSNAWRAHPVRLTAAESGILKVDAGIAILENRVIQPTKLANLDEDQIQLRLLSQIDSEYRAAMHSYKKDLIAATALDLEEHGKTTKKFKVLEDFPLIARIFMEIAGKKFVDRDTLAHKVQFARQAWLVKVATAEEARLASVKDKLITAVTLKTKQLTLPALANDKVHLEANQLTQVYEALFPNDASQDITELKDIMSKRIAK